MGEGIPYLVVIQTVVLAKSQSAGLEMLIVQINNPTRKSDNPARTSDNPSTNTPINVYTKPRHLLTPCKSAAYNQSLSLIRNHLV
jgi:hypothetical protein